MTATPDARAARRGGAGVAQAAPAPPSPRHLYVHVPFCRARCDYCDFASQAVTDVARAGEPRGLFDRYVEALHGEWAAEAARWRVQRLETVYVGGGTPSLLGPERLERLLEPFRPYLTAGAEITIEANPDDVDAGFAAWAATAGPTSDLCAGSRSLRVSLGVQSFDRALRESLGRRSRGDAREAFARLSAAGVARIGIDMIYGGPGQTAAALEADLAAVARLRPGHVSWYELTIAEGTMLAATVALAEAGRLGWDAAQVPDDDARAAMFARIVRALARLGYRWYEVSNFALPGHRARHNEAYWRARPYLGLGAGAVSTVGGLRWRNSSDVDAYLARLGARPAAAGSAPPAPPRFTEHLDALTLARERLMLASRCGASVSLSDIAEVVDVSAVPALAEVGLVSLRGGRLSVTRKGRYVANEVCVRLFRDCRL